MTRTRIERLLLVLTIVTAMTTAALMMQGCLHQTMNLTPEAQYYGALKTFNDNVSTYLDAYRTASPETQAKWKQSIDPLILAANQALQTWRLSLGTPTAAQKEQVWIDAQKKFMAILMASGIIKVERGS